MVEIVNKNKNFLASGYPSILKRLCTIKVSRSFYYSVLPKPNIYYNKKPLHSRLNPEAEALNLVKNLNVKQGCIYLFMGIGLGYHIELFKKLYRDRIKNITIIAIEKNPDVFRLLAENRDITFLKDVKLFIGEDPENIKNFFECLNPISIKGYRILKLRNDISLDTDYYTELEIYFKTITSLKLSDILTHLAFENLWIKNIISNIPFISDKSSINELKNLLKSKPVLVIGAGPSLVSQFKIIRQIAQKIHIIAVDTVLEPLLINDIVPDFLVTLDSQFYNIYDFQYAFTKRTICKDINLIADIFVSPIILKNWKGKIFLNYAVNSSSDAHPLAKRLKNYLPSISPLSCGGSVATTAIEFALFLGADPVYVTGLDLSYTNYMTHISSSPSYNLQYLSSNRFKTINTSMLKSIRQRKLKYLKGIDGNNVLSDFIFQNYLNWINERKDYNGRVYNLTNTGVTISSLWHLNHRELLKVSSNTRNKNAIKVAYSKSFGKDQLLNFLIDFKKDLSDVKVKLNESNVTETFLNKLIEKYQFLQNNIVELNGLYKNTSIVKSKLLILLKFIESEIEKSLQKLKNR